MTSFSNFSANETLSASNMTELKGGSTTAPRFDMNVVSILKQKYAGAASQQFTLVTKGIAYTVTLDAVKHVMCIKNADGAVVMTKY